MKRSIRTNRYGNVVGYEGRSRVAEFGDDWNSSDIGAIWAQHPEYSVQDARDAYYQTR